MTKRGRILIEPLSWDWWSGRKGTVRLLVGNLGPQERPWLTACCPSRLSPCFSLTDHQGGMVVKAPLLLHFMLFYLIFFLKKFARLTAFTQLGSSQWGRGG